MNITRYESLLRLINSGREPSETRHAILMILLEHPERKYDEDGTLLPPTAEEKGREKEIFDLIREKRQDVWQSYVAWELRCGMDVFFTEDKSEEPEAETAGV